MFMSQQIPYLGVIEGFYGKTWSWALREHYADFLSQSAYQFYIYAPKADHYLRTQWFDHWPAEQWRALFSLRECYAKAGVDWGIGLSPFELYKDWGSDKRRLLEQKVKTINQLKPDIFCVLFDDMDGDKSGLADLQLEITDLIAQHSSARRIIICPTYYSFDPVLEKLFGKRPAGYWERLGNKLPPDIDIFWTGDRVCSDQYSQASLKMIADVFQRKPFIWDNYPVNDGRLSSQFLHLAPFENRPQQMAEWCAGHAANPMNAAQLSKIPLLTLLDSYRLGAKYETGAAMNNALKRICSNQLAEKLAADVDIFQSHGLDKLSDEQQQSLLRRYQLLDDPCAREVCQWLRGHFRFDPACLTG